MTRGNYGHYEQGGGQQPSMGDVPQLAIAMGCHPCDFFEEVPTGGGKDIYQVIARQNESLRELDQELADLKFQMIEQGIARPSAFIKETQTESEPQAEPSRSASRNAADASGREQAPAYTPTLGDEMGKDLLDVMQGMSPKRATMLLGMLKLMEEAEIE